MSEFGDYTEEFSAWIIPAYASPTSEVFQWRWDGAAQTAARLEASRDETIDCVRILFELPLHPEREARFRQSFVHFDPRFASSSSSLEMRLLAGAVLGRLMRSSGKTARLASVAVLAASGGGSRTTEQTRPFVELAEEERRRLATSAPGEDNGQGPPARLLESGAALPPAEFQAAVVDYLLKDCSLRDKRFSRAREEAEIAWWILGQYSRDLEIPMSEVPQKASPVIFAKELADLTRSEIGPRASKAILNRALSFQKRLPATISLTSAVEALPARWPSLLRRSTSVGLPDALTPVLRLIYARAEAPAEEWQYVTSPGVPNEFKCTPLELASQVYEEMLLLRMLSDGSHSGEA